MNINKDEDPKSKDIPDVVVDTATRKRYIKGRFLGKVRYEGILTIQYNFINLRRLNSLLVML